MAGQHTQTAAAAETLRNGYPLRGLVMAAPGRFVPGVSRPSRFVSPALPV
jgi:hypothetical protein